MTTPNFPVHLTPFVGRRVELAQIIERLHEPACRLLTLVGPGGVGKTRLAIEAAAQTHATFTHSAHFVPLQLLTSDDILATAVADALKLSLSGPAAPEQQLCHYLRDKELLLVLDNFEQLLTTSDSHQATKGIGLLQKILEGSPAVSLLITSREALTLPGEWLYPVNGLSYPPDSTKETAEALLRYGAVRLFVERAQQIRPVFSLAQNKTNVLRICRLVEGSPLALEIAASWTKTLSCAEIVEEIQHNLDFLQTNLRHVPERHQSMQAVFDQSWGLLDQEERHVFKQLSVFRGDFERAAAEKVAGASMAHLSGLVDKSLLRRENGRYHLHQLLHQYAQEKLAESPQAEKQYRDLHAAFFADFLQQRLEHLMGGQQKAAIAEIEVELENIRAAWQWMIQQTQVNQLQKASQALALFYQFQSRFLEGAKALTNAAHALGQAEATKERDLALLKILMDQAWFYIRLGRLTEAESVLTHCQEIYQRHQIPPVSGHGTDPAVARGIIASIHGDYAEAARLGEQARRTSETHTHLWNRQFAHYLLSRAAQAQGQYDAAQTYARQAYALTQETGDRWFMAYCHNEMGNVARALNAYQEARQHYQAAFALRESFDDPEGMALALIHLGETAVLQEKYDEAQQLYQRSRDIYEKTNDRGGLATVLKGLGQAAAGLGHHQEAQTYLRQALQIATEIPFMPLIFSLLLAIGDLWLQTGRAEQGLALLALAQHHPASNQRTKAEAEQLLANYETAVPPETFKTAVRRGRESDLEKTTRSLLAKLALPLATTAASITSQLEKSAPVEPLTPRESDVLPLLAQGLTNKEIAKQLTIVEGTVKAHNHNIYSKLGVDNRTEAVARARELGLLP